MTDDSQRRLRQTERAFFGAATASATHEINNVLAIINEYAGLLGDLAAGAQAGRPLDPDRIAKTAGAIQRQIKRGEAIVKRLSRFAHSVDRPARRVELNALIDDAAGLAERLAEMKRVRLERQAPPETLNADTDPFGLTHAIFTAIMQALEAAGDGGAVTIALRPASGGAAVDIFRATPDATPAATELGAAKGAAEANAAPDVAEADAAPDSLPLLMDALGGEVRTAEAGAPGVTLFIPTRAGCVSPCSFSPTSGAKH